MKRRLLVPKLQAAGLSQAPAKLLFFSSTRLWVNILVFTINLAVKSDTQNYKKSQPYDAYNFILHLSYGRSLRVLRSMLWLFPRSKPYVVDLWPILIVNTRRRIGSGTFITLYLGEYLLLPISVFPVISFTSDSENNVTDFDINEDTPDDKPPRSTAIAINRCFIIEFPF